MANAQRRFEYVEGTSKKFWEVQLDGTSLILRWGRMGAEGQTKTKRLVSPAKAAAKRDALIQEKLGKGYVEVKGTRSPNTKGAVIAPTSGGDPLAKLDALWTEKRPDLRRALRKPVAPSVLDELQRAVGLPLPGLLRRFYEWHDGCRDEHLSVEGFFGWPSAKGALKEKRMLDKLCHDGHFSDWPPGQWWNQSWLPFLGFNNEEFVCLDLAGTLGKGRGAVFVRRNADPRRVVLAPTFPKWLEQHIAVTASGPTDADEEAWIDHFGGRKATRIRGQIARGFPVVVTARRA